MGKKVSPINGVKIGHQTRCEDGTGVTAIIFDKPVKAVAAFTGSASSTRQFDSLFLGHSVRKIDAICLTGGSAFGLGSGIGVQLYMKEQGRGLLIRNRIRVPIVPTAAIFDLLVGKESYPDVEDGYLAAASAKEEFETGSVGAGTGATAGKIFGYERATKGGFGAAWKRVGDVTVFALVVVNNFGNVLGSSGEIIAGIRGEKEFVNLSETAPFYSPLENTNLVVIITDGTMEREDLLIAGRIASGSFGRFFSPPSSSADGDVLIMVSAGEKRVLPDVAGYAAIEVTGRAIEDAISSASSCGNVPSVSDWRREVGT